MPDYISDKAEYQRLVRNARQADLWSYLHANAPDSFKLEGRIWLHMVDDPSVKVRKDWSGAMDYAGKRGRSGRMNPIEFLQEMLNKPFLEAVTELQPYSRINSPIAATAKATSKKYKPTVQVRPTPLPHPLSNVTQPLYDYLCGIRKIPEEVVKNVISKNLLYVADGLKIYGIGCYAAVFANKSRTFAVARAMLSPLPDNIRPHRTYALSPITYWRWAPGVSPDTAYLCEGAIDALSLYALLPEDKAVKGIFCAAGGANTGSHVTSVIRAAEAAKMRIIVATDADAAGDSVADYFKEHLVKRLRPKCTKDWSEYLMRKEDKS